MKPYELRTKVYLSAFPNREFEIMDSKRTYKFVNGLESEEIYYTCFNHSDRMTINSVHANVTPKDEVSVDRLLEKLYDARTMYEWFNDPYYLEQISTYEGMLQSHSSRRK